LNPFEEAGTVRREISSKNPMRWRSGGKGKTGRSSFPDQDVFPGMEKGFPLK